MKGREAMTRQAMNKLSKARSELGVMKFERPYTGATTKHAQRAYNKAQRRMGKALCQEGMEQ